MKQRRQADRRFNEEREGSLLKELQRCKDEEAERARLQVRFLAYSIVLIIYYIESYLRIGRDELISSISTRSTRTRETNRTATTSSRWSS